MAVPRPVVLLVALGAALMMATLVAAMNARESTDGGPVGQPAQNAQPRAREAPKAKAHARAQAKAKAHARAQAKAKAQTPLANAEPQPGPRRTTEEQRKPAAGATLPAGVSRAIAQRRTVVLFFYQPGSADDEKTGQSVKSLRSGRVRVFTAPIDRVADYAPVVGGFVSRAPSTVIVRPAARRAGDRRFCGPPQPGPRGGQRVT